MPIGILFWVLMILWAVMGIWEKSANAAQGWYLPIIGNVLLFIVIALLGWRLFGPVLQ